MKCINCGGESSNKFCPYCGAEMPYNGPDTVVNDNSQKTIINNYYYGGKPAASNYANTESAMPSSSTYLNSPDISDKNKLVALFLCLFVGFLGVHYFYVGRIGKGILYMFTGGLFGIGWFVDLFKISTGKFKDKDGRYLVKDTMVV